MPSAKPASSSTSANSVPPDLAALFRGITPQQLSSVSSQIGMTADEHSRVSSAMGDPAFLRLLADYAREMSDPEVKRQQEEALRKMEHEAGVKGGKAHKQSTGVRRQQSTNSSDALDVD